MLDSFLSPEVLASLARALAPLLLLGLGGILCHRAGIFNIALEGLLLAGAFAAVATSALTGSALLGVLAAAASGLLVSGALGFGAVARRGDPLVLGVALNLLVAGLTSFLLWALFEVRGTYQSPDIVALPKLAPPPLDELPGIGPAIRTLTPLSWIALLAVVGVHLFLTRTVAGLRLRGVGERPEAAATLGVRPARHQWAAVAASGVLGGLAGAQLSLGSVALFTENMSAGRGWIVVLALMLTDGRVWQTLGVLTVFAYVDAVGFRLQAHGLPVQLSDAAPYLATLVVIVLLGISRRRRRRADALSAPL